MKNFRLKVFLTAANRLSFTKAAKELYISQPAVTKHIVALEKHFNTKLFARKGSNIELTEAGKLLQQYGTKIDNIYSLLDFEMGILQNEHKGKLVIGTSTTMTQYVIPPLMAHFHQKFKNIVIHLVNGNTEQIEKALTGNQIDLGIIEGQSKRKDFKYIDFLKDEIVLTAKSSHPLAKKGGVSLTELRSYPLLLREKGSGTLEVIEYFLKGLNYSITDFNVEMHFGSTEGIKNYILNSNSVAFLSIQSIYNELSRNELSIIDINELEMIRNFNFIVDKGNTNPLVDLFIQFALNYNF